MVVLKTGATGSHPLQTGKRLENCNEWDVGANVTKSKGKRKMLTRGATLGTQIKERGFMLPLAVDNSQSAGSH